MKCVDCAQRRRFTGAPRRLPVRLRGLNALKPSNPSDWIGSMVDPNLWAILAIEEAVDTLDLIQDAALREQVREVLDKYGRPEPAWAPAVEFENSARYRICAQENRLAPQRTVLDKFAARDALPLKLPLMKFGDPAYQEQYRRMQRIYEHSGDPAWQQCNLKPQLPAALMAAGHELRPGLEDPQTGSRQVAPMTGLPGVCLEDPHGKAGTHCWRVIFSGERDRDDRLPLYWIQYIPSGELLAWERQLKNMLVLLPPLLVDPAAMDDPTGAGMAALWRIEPADAPQGSGDPKSRHIVHHLTRQKLRVMGFCRGELGDDKRLDGGGPSLCDPWRIVATSKDADWARRDFLPAEKAWRLNAERWILSEVVD